MGERILILTLTNIYWRSEMQIRMTRWMQYLAIVIAACSLWTLPGSAQTFRGGISGIVTDTSGAAVSGADVQAVNDDTRQLRQTVSSSAGEFTFEDMPLGTYTITVTAAGFQTIKTTKVPVSAGSVYNLPVKVSPASASTTVEVTASALALDTTSTTQTS